MKSPRPSPDRSSPAPATSARRSGRGDKESAQAVRKRLERECEILDRNIQRFRVEFQRFLAGDLPMPPEELRTRIQDMLRRLRSSNLKTAALNFRLGSLEARFSSLQDLYGRRLRKREEGELAAHRAAEAARPDPDAGVVIGAGGDASSVNALYKRLYLGRGTSTPSVDLERFRSYVERQAATIRKKTGCTDIQFRVARDEGGELKLKARPVRDS